MENKNQRLNTEVTLIELLLWYWRSKYIVLATYIIGGLTVIIWVSNSPEIYQVQASYYASLEKYDVRDQHSAILRTMPIAKFKARQRMLQHPSEYLNITVDPTPPLHGHLPAVIITMRGESPEELSSRMTKVSNEILNEVTARTIRRLETENAIILGDEPLTRYDFYVNKLFENTVLLMQLENTQAGGFEITKPYLFYPRLDRIIVFFALSGFGVATVLAAINSLIRYMHGRIRLRIESKIQSTS